VRTTAPLTPDAVLRNYVHAKDENRAHLLDAVFTTDAVLEVRNQSSAIAFPDLTQGREAVGDVLVRQFGQTYENVYTFYLDRPVLPARAFSCGWVIAMTDKATRGVRVGCGRYDWVFDPAPPYLACRITISIDAMEVLPASAWAETWRGLQRLGYPWTSAAEAASALPNEPALAPMREHLRRA
jgi:hypothetical protein